MNTIIEKGYYGIIPKKGERLQYRLSFSSACLYSAFSNIKYKYTKVELFFNLHLLNHLFEIFPLLHK